VLLPAALVVRTVFIAVADALCCSRCACRYASERKHIAGIKCARGKDGSFTLSFTAKVPLGPLRVTIAVNGRPMRGAPFVLQHVAA
jgi:hypothetical protein